jgi:hypothetical protein
VSAIAGDWEAARRIELVLPETGVCSGDGADGGTCCGTVADDPVAVPVPVPVALGNLTRSLPPSAERAVKASGTSCC